MPRSAVAGLCLALLPPAVAGAEVSAPDPPRGRSAATTLALLHHQRDLCDGIAGQVIGHWLQLDQGGQGASRDGREAAIRDFVLETQLSDLAASRATADLIDRFLPRARADTNAETVSSLERLFDLAKSLCDTVALPTAPLEGFQQRVAEILERIEREQAELGRLLVVPRADLEAALEPYLLPIQLAGIDAEGEYLQYLDSIRPKPEPPTTAERMAAWHRTAYLPAVASTKQALADYMRARRANDGRALGTACRELSKAVIELLRHESVFRTPDEKVGPPLQRAFIEMRGLATHCAAGRYREVEQHSQAMQEHLGRAAERLKLYGLRP